MIRRGDIWWVDFGTPRGSEPKGRRPGLVVSADFLNRSELQTVSIAAITSNVRLALRPGNVLLPQRTAGLPRESVVNVTQLLTVDKGVLQERVGQLPGPLLTRVDEGLKLALALT